MNWCMLLNKDKWTQTPSVHCKWPWHSDVFDPSGDQQVTYDRVLVISNGAPVPCVTWRKNATTCVGQAVLAEGLMNIHAEIKGSSPNSRPNHGHRSIRSNSMTFLIRTPQTDNECKKPYAAILVCCCVARLHSTFIEKKTTTQIVMQYIIRYMRK